MNLFRKIKSGARPLIGALAVLAWTATGINGQEAKSSRSAANDADRSLAEGRRTFESRCAACHGLDGRGSDRAPDIATRASTRRRSDAEIARIIQDGIPSGGMPSFGAMEAPTIAGLVKFLRLLQGNTGGGASTGDPQKGKALFFGKARCAECHTLNGTGGFIASDLSDYGRTRSPSEIRGAIVRPGKTEGAGASLSNVTTSDGRQFSGIVRNEDNFSMQLQTLDGAFHLFAKTELVSATQSSDPLMPSDYAQRLNAGELDDLVSFMVRSSKEDPGGKSPAVPMRNTRKKPAGKSEN